MVSKLPRAEWSNKGFAKANLTWSFPRILHVKLQSLVHSEYVYQTIFMSVLPNVGFIMPKAEIVGKLVNQAVDEHFLCNLEAA